MIRLFTALCILALGPLAEAQGLETVVRDAPEDRERNDSERGIHVSIEQFVDEFPNSSSASSGSSTGIVNGAKYSVSVITSDTSRKTFRMRLTKETLRHLIVSRDEHLFLRFLAVRDLPKADLDVKTKRALMKLAIEQQDALVRSIAARAIPHVKPQAEVADLLVLLLNDPCMDVASLVLSPLVDHYDLREESGEKLKLLDNEGFSKGPPSWFYFRHHQDALRVALALQAKDKKLIAPEVVVAIRSRAIPSDEWFLSVGQRPADLDEARNRFIEQYLRQAE